MESIWRRMTEIEERQPLLGDVRADAVVIGAGMAGMLTAYYLKQCGLNVVVLEAERIGGGQTGKTTAKVTSQHNLIYRRLIKDFDIEGARCYAAANERAIREYGRLVDSLSIDCQWEEVPAYLYSVYQDENLRAEVEAARRLGIDASFVEETKLPFAVKGAVRFERQAQFQPLEFLKALAGQVTVYEHSRVVEVKEHLAVTDKGSVQAKHLVFATHYPFLNHPGYYFMRLHQERSYVVALEGAPDLEGVYLGVDEDGLSFRNSQGLLLLGGGGHRTGENRKGGRYEELLSSANHFWPEARETACWSAQDCMTLDGIPYIGPFSASTPDWYVATGFGKWGMTNSMVAAQLISDQIMGKENGCEKIYSPQRFEFSSSAKHLVEEGLLAARGLSRKWLAPPKITVEQLPCGHGGVVEYDGEKACVYRDESGRVFAMPARCPHLGCQLEWNPDEKSWDCPCHGSRFDYMGNLIDNPAQEGLRHEE